ncbi:MAG: nickel pincer cofactor biosynthesis protein LarC [Lachnospiraceae bacterium]|uniref:nickel pincer cofactor biosynthesis protein LarC n=1 Tax=uncultured Acetatifactor sp. TaxID=1671927 RepID=UPI00263252A4|nr:nickel pincer cofactor biosynthesis protein LarC [uncultured Acetatifactor sp.]MCI8787581.1 nickel pincer cofactor biosynthesis protein LarC [Lachnospiraceae bacterium]
MKTLYLDCGMGAAGDMLAAALLELLPDGDAFLEEVNTLGIPGVRIERETAVKCGITGTHISVTVNGMEEESLDAGHEHLHEHHTHHMVAETAWDGGTEEHSHDHDGAGGHHHHASNGHGENDGHHHHHGHGHHHSSLHDIEHIVRRHLPLPEKVREDVMSVYKLIAEAESHAHGVPVTEIHFHEVGTMDAIADITMVCLLMDKLSPEEVVVSPVHVGSGQVRCAHGILPVPAPATAHILKDVPIYGGTVKGELCTPTGAALLKHFAARFGSMPAMRTRAIGYGMGKKDFEAANCVRAILGDTEGGEDSVLELSCNVDDMSAEQISFAMERLFEGGALDVYTVPIGMKKSRPGVLLRVLTKEQDKEKILGLLFRHTTTIGVRETRMQRYVLDRKMTSVETPYGTVRCKESTGYGVKRTKYEYEDLAAIAREKGISLEELRAMLDAFIQKT